MLSKDNNLSVKDKTNKAVVKYGYGGIDIGGDCIIRQIMLNQLVLIGECLEKDPNDEIKSKTYSQTLTNICKNSPSS